MEHTGFEPVTSTLPVWRAPGCANAPSDKTLQYMQGKIKLKLYVLIRLLRTERFTNAGTGEICKKSAKRGANRNKGGEMPEGLRPRASLLAIYSYKV